MGEGPVMVTGQALQGPVLRGYYRRRGPGRRRGRRYHRRGGERGTEHSVGGSCPGDQFREHLVLRAQRTATPIKHVVVIFDENISFDHYFGTYPYATNTDGSTFHAKRGTPTVNGLYTKITSSGPTGPLLTKNPNGMRASAAQPGSRL